MTNSTKALPQFIYLAGSKLEVRTSSKYSIAEEERIYSSSLDDMCLFKCQVCDKILYHSLLAKHISKAGVYIFKISGEGGYIFKDFGEMKNLTSIGKFSLSKILKSFIFRQESLIFNN